jgi:plastocyanin
MRSVPMLALILSIGVFGCSSSGGSYGTGPGTGGRTLTPHMAGSAFSPTPDTVAVGSMVTWTNNDAYGHTVTSVPGSSEVFDSPVAGGGSFSHTFSTAGTYGYYCKIHGAPTSGMRGTIVVQ